MITALSGKVTEVGSAVGRAGIRVEGVESQTMQLGKYTVCCIILFVMLYYTVLYYRQSDLGV
jgi:hypothetical protein